jgi:hypothetical protein
VQGVPQPARQLTRALPAAALAACALALAACGGDDDRDGGGGKGVERPAGLPADFNLQVFSCADWNKAGEPVRRYVLDQLHELGNDQVIGPGVQGRGSVLTDEQATEMFDSTCANPRTRGFVLYKIYAFSRGFRGSSPPPPPGS